MESAPKTKKDVKALPPPDPNSKDAIPIQLGDTVQMDDMGPIIINADGSMRRIANWDKMTESEQAVAWRRISKRNEERRKILKDQMQENEEEEGGKR